MGVQASSPRRKSVWSFLKKLNTDLVHDPAILLLLCVTKSTLSTSYYRVAFLNRIYSFSIYIILETEIA